jgi:hypothetical protein
MILNALDLPPQYFFLFLIKNNHKSLKMKNLVFIALPFFLFFACTEAPKNTTVVETSKTVVSDSASIANTIHSFYKWYNVFSMDTTKRVDFADQSGKYIRLDEPKMKKYFSYFQETGFVSTAFIENEFAFYRKCGEFWKTEEVGDVPTGMDADKYYCAQDWETEFWTNSPVRIKMVSPDSVFATLFSRDKNDQLERNFELKKENGKWLLAKIECDMGVQ